ncbi:hypothetical protein [Escherichia coli]|uniref:hypothetical protein n=1 Tax=Escherichia coli TaxID=562 RepID=UPI00374D1AF7
MSELTAAHSTIEKAREVTNCPADVDLQWWVGQLMTRLNSVTSENEALKFSKPSLGTMMAALDAFYADDEVPERAMMAAYDIFRESVQTPTTDSILRAAEARGVDSGIDTLMSHLNHQHPAVEQAIHILRIHANRLREGKAE